MLREGRGWTSVVAVGAVAMGGLVASGGVPRVRAQQAAGVLLLVGAVLGAFAFPGVFEAAGARHVGLVPDDEHGDRGDGDGHDGDDVGERRGGWTEAGWGWMWHADAAHAGLVVARLLSVGVAVEAAAASKVDFAATLVSCLVVSSVAYVLVARAVAMALPPSLAESVRSAPLVGLSAVSVALGVLSWPDLATPRVETFAEAIMYPLAVPEVSWPSSVSGLVTGVVVRRWMDADARRAFAVASLVVFVVGEVALRARQKPLPGADDGGSVVARRVLPAMDDEPPATSTSTRERELRPDLNALREARLRSRGALPSSS